MGEANVTDQLFASLLASPNNTVANYELNNMLDLLDDLGVYYYTDGDDNVHLLWMEDGTSNTHSLTMLLQSTHAMYLQLPHIAIPATSRLPTEPRPLGGPHSPHTPPAYRAPPARWTTSPHAPLV